jgi:crossover junction endodeoxyribonuclease RuvC
MKILGIDPGTVVMGYGVIENEGDDIALVDFGAIKVPEHSEIGERLSLLYNRLIEIINQHHPDTVAVESPFFSRNVKSAMAIGRAQAIALLAAANCHIPAFEYSPAKVKQLVAGFGASGKEQVQEMVRLQLGMAEAPQPADAADALAIAICHIQESRLQNLIAGQRGRK